MLSTSIFTTVPVYAESPDYLISFKVPIQQSFCMTKSLNGDMATYKQCMLKIEKVAHECDAITKPKYDRILSKSREVYPAPSDVFEVIKPITQAHFDCLGSIYDNE